jgi:hypothetical protein
MQTTSQAEIGLAGIDECIADADHNITQLGSLIPKLASKGYATDMIERDVTLLTKALHGVRARRREILAALDGDEPPPRIARQITGSRRGSAAGASSAGTAWASVSSWRSLRIRLRRS